MSFTLSNRGTSGSINSTSAVLFYELMLFFTASGNVSRYAVIYVMPFYRSYLQTAANILASYQGEMPFSIFLKNFFSKEKKYGSRDRKAISSLCYNYFRMGNSLPGKPIEEKMLAALFICTSIPNELLQMQKPEWNENIAKPLVQKLTLAGIDVTTIFPFNHELSGEIDWEAFNVSMLIQPNVFVRIRPGKLALVKEKLTASQIAFKEINESCFAFANGVKLDTVLDINKEVIIQDMNSQRVIEMFTELPQKDGLKVWDCCAASGGKSMMAYDTFAHIQLTVSDIRKSIIRNLHKRFEEAGIHAFTSFVADVANAESLHSTLAGTLFNLVICDAPCSGSGTWSRTPEQLLLFKKEEILRYAALQKRIAANAAKYVEKGGWFLYITCSVFAKENEDAVKFIEENTSLKLCRLNLLKGYEMKSDSMFAALFQNSD